MNRDQNDWVKRYHVQQMETARERQLSLEKPNYPPKPHDARCQCVTCQAWSREIFEAGTTRARAVVDGAGEVRWPPRPHLRSSPERPSFGGVCACDACTAWARAIVAAEGVKRAIGPEPVPPFVKKPKPLPPISPEARAAAEAHLRELLALNNDPRRNR